jgi:hypothetical protein
MYTTKLVTMRKNLKKIDAREIYYFRWDKNDPFTIMASDGERYGQLITIGYRHELGNIGKLGLPVYKHCPFS